MRERDLLASTTVLFGSNLGNANSHSALHLPIMVAGGPFHHGSHVMAGRSAEEDAPLSNLFVTLLRTMGMEIDSFRPQRRRTDLELTARLPGVEGALGARASRPRTRRRRAGRTHVFEIAECIATTRHPSTLTRLTARCEGKMPSPPARTSATRR